MKPEGWKITAWALGELDGPEADEVAAAIAADPAVADEVEAVMASAMYARRELEMLPASAAPKAAVKVERTVTGPVGAVAELAPRRARAPAWRWAVGVGVALAAAIALVVALSEHEDPPTPSATPLAVAPTTAPPLPTTGGPAEHAAPAPRVAETGPAEDPDESSVVAGAGGPEPHGEDTAARPGASPPEVPAADAATPALTIIVDPPTATLMVSKGRIEARGNGLYEVHGLAAGDVVKVRAEKADGSGTSQEVRVGPDAAVTRIRVAERASERVEPAPTAPTTPEKGTGEIKIAARPWAQITIDGEVVGTTPLTRTVAAGRHVVTFRKGSRTQKKVVTVRPGARAVVFYDFAETKGGFGDF